MAVKIIIKRIVPENKAEALKPLLQKLRNLECNNQATYPGKHLRESIVPVRIWLSAHGRPWMTGGHGCSKMTEPGRRKKLIICLERKPSMKSILMIEK